MNRHRKSSVQKVSGDQQTGAVNTALPQPLVVRVTDTNGKESRAVAQVQIVPTQTRSGESVGDPTAGLNLSFDLSGILQPVAITFLTFGMYVVLTMVGGAISRAGWNLIKPKPETIRVRLKPRDLTRAIEEDSAAMVRLPPPPA